MAQVARYLTIPQARERLAGHGIEVTEETVRAWVRAGQISAIRLPGGSYRIRTEVIDAITEKPAQAGAA